MFQSFSNQECEVLRKMRFGDSNAAFSVVMWTTPKRDDRGQTVCGYRVKCIRSNGAHTEFPAGAIVFESEDFAGSPLHVDDSDETFGALLGFLSLRPGDTDPEYFEDYTPAQHAFAEYYGEELAVHAIVLEECAS